jgi:hypothetical protein
VNVALARCAEYRQSGRAARRCPDCRAPVHARCQAAHAYRVVLALAVDSARGLPASWDWPSRLGLHPPEHVLAEVTRNREAVGDRDNPWR